MKEAIAVVGPTACGKTHRGVEIARQFFGEILSGDSRQVYRDMSIGTGKDIFEYEEIPYHLIDICPAGYKYNLHEYLRDFRSSYSDVRNRGKLPVIVGGSGMYVENALNGIYMPEVPENKELRESLSGKSLEELTEILRGFKTLHNKTDVDTEKRAVRAIEIETYYSAHPDEAIFSKRTGATRIDALVIGLEIDRETRRTRITRRMQERLDAGMVEEVKSLLDSGIKADDLIYYGLEYKFITLYLTGKLDYSEMYTGLETAIHQFAKRQMTWWRGMEKRGWTINWIPYNLSEDEFLTRVDELMHNS